jgi:hypothetical protein
VEGNGEGEVQAVNYNLTHSRKAAPFQD